MAQEHLCQRCFFADAYGSLSFSGGYDVPRVVPGCWRTRISADNRRQPYLFLLRMPLFTLVMNRSIGITYLCLLGVPAALCILRSFVCTAACFICTPLTN